MLRHLKIIIFCIIFTIFFCDNAHAEPVSIITAIGYILMYAGLAAETISWGWVIAGAALVVAGSLWQAQQTKKALSAFDRDFKSSGYLVNTRQANKEISVIYGEVRVGGNQVFIGVSGEENEWLHIIQIIGEGEIDSVPTIYLDDKTSTDPFFSSYVETQIKTGTPDQAVISGLPDGWNLANRHTAYLYIKFKFNPNKFQSLPLITCLVKGRKLYDPRTGLTVYSNNPALVIWDIITNKRYGLGFATALMDVDSFIEAANFCDQPYINDPNFKFTFNGSINTQDHAGDLLDKVLLNMRGYLVFSEGKYKLKSYNYDSPVMSITADNIVEDSFNITLPGLPETPNKLQVVFIDPEQNWVANPFTYEDLNAITIDGMEREDELNLIGTSNYDQAARLAAYYFERLRLNKQFSCGIGSKGIPLEVGDTISMTYDVPGWTDRICRITDISYLPNHDVGITFAEEDAMLYDTVLNISPHNYFSGSFPDPSAVAPSIYSVVFTEELAYNKDLTYTRVKVTFIKPGWVWWSYVDVYISFDGVDYKFLTSAFDVFYIDPAEDGKTYYLKFYSVSIHGVKQADAEAPVYTYNVIGSNLAPQWPVGAAFNAIVAGDVINFRWTAVQDIDLAGYEVRRGDSWGSGVVVAFIKTTTFMAVGVKPGQHHFMVRAKDTVGNYTSTELYADVAVIWPPNYTNTGSWIEDGDLDVVVDNCNDVWTTYSGVSCVVDTADKKEGTGSIKLTVPQSMGIGRLATEDFTPILITNLTHIGLWIKSDINFDAGDLLLLLDDTAGCISPLETLSLPALTVNTWTYVNLSLVNPALLNSIVSVGISTAVDKPTGFTLWLDDVKAREGAHYNTAWKQDGLDRVLYVIGQDEQGQLKGYWESPVYSLGTQKDMRFWSLYELIQYGDETTWGGKYGLNDTWAKYNSSMTWGAIFSQTLSSNFRMELLHSVDGISWTTIPFFHIYSAEINTKYIKYRVYLEDVSDTVFLYIKPPTLVRAYWQ